MIAFYCEPVREYDNAGRLIAAGVEWREGSFAFRAIARYLLLLLAAVIGCLVIGFMITAVGTHDAALLAYLPWGIGLIAYWVLYLHFMRRMPRDRRMTFNVWDSTETPLGLTGVRWPRRVEELPNHRPSILTSIEVRQAIPIVRSNYPAAVVRLMTSSGDIREVAGDLHEVEATRIARQLTIAVEAIRREMELRGSFPADPPA